ncbi:probable purine permease 11 [Papaver somniferum]|uniref:probable purine permease 11 n=1 Tax=Papaver somniferum TaxID=3469 RepID=UPI000E6F6439|nr:probable purine permease 11 [Papaver somniferum]
MNFTHLAFYNREVTLEDVLRKPQRVPERSLYKFAFGAETRLEQALALIDMLALVELIEVMRFARMRRNIISVERDHHQELEGLFEEMAEHIAMDDAEAAALDDVAAGGAQESKEFRVTLYGFLLVSGQSVATLLGELYYDKGGNSKWMATLVQSAGFPVLFIPLIVVKVYLPPPTSSTTTLTTEHSASISTLALLYISLGVLIAGNGMLYSYGLLYLPVSTYSLLCSTQLVFNAIFSFFINSQKFTAFIFNSLILLTMSVVLLAIDPDGSSNSTTIPEGKYVIGFICTLSASAGYSLLLSLTELSFRKVIKNETILAVLEMSISTSVVSTCTCLVGLFASGDWRRLKNELNDYGQGSVSYLMTLVWIAVTWQVSSVGLLGLVFEASSLFSNVISTLGLPIVPIFSVIFFHDKLDGVKIVAMLLSLWGFVSYIYQHYLDDCKAKETNTVDDQNEEKC